VVGRGVEGSFRFLKRLGRTAGAKDAVRRRRRVRRRDADARSGARDALAPDAQQANYDYERIQYNTVVSAGYKMLNTLEALPRDARGRGARPRGCRSCCACSIGRAAHRVVAVGRARLRRRHVPARRGVAGRRHRALEQDEIELVLQVNGKLRGKLVVRRRRTDAIEAAARSSPDVARHVVARPCARS